MARDDAPERPPLACPPEHREGDDAIARHRDELARHFPLPRDEELRRPRPRKAGAAALLLCLALGVLWWDPAYRSEEHASAVGERRVLALADGSRIVLDAASHIAIDWRLRSRRVALLDGRARFEVAPARWRPFHVDADGSDVRVVGTVFDVQRSPGRVAVTVAAGRVRVVPAADGEVRLLSPGQQLVVEHGFAGPALPVDIGARTGWVEGRLEFERTPLAEVLVELQRSLHAPVELADASLGTLQVSGVFDSRRADQALDLLPDILPVVVVRERDGRVRILAR